LTQVIHVTGIFTKTTLSDQIESAVVIPSSQK